MKFLVGDEFGLIKCVDVGKKLVVNKSGEMNKKNGVLSINNLIENNNQFLAVAHETNFYVLDWNSQQIKSQPEIKAIKPFDVNSKILLTSQVVKRTVDFSSVILARNDSKLNILQYDEDLNLKLENEIDIKTQKLELIKDGQTTQEIFCLFRGTPVSIFNLEKSEFTWRSKNVPNDEFNLKVPIWDVDVAFSEKNPNLFYTATAYGEIRTYDKKVKPRPMSEKKVTERKITRMLMSNCENYLTIGDNIGGLYMLDKRKSKLIFILFFIS